MYRRFEIDIMKMNRRYELDAIAIFYAAAVRKRLEQFSDILNKEFAELTDIEVEATKLCDKIHGDGQPPTDEERNAALLSVRTNFADLLGDIVVYCASEAARWKIPLEDVLRVIMLSNDSKLGADGKPIKNPENGKFEKGPNYWKPEPAIEYILRTGSTDGLIVHMQEGGVPTIEIPGATTETSNGTQPG